MYWCESWTIKKTEHWRIDAFELWCWRRLLRVPWTARRSNQLILKEISPEYSLEGLMLKLKLQYFPTWCEELAHWKRPWCWERLKAGEERDNRRWDSWMASPTRWIWVWASSRSWWWTGKPGVLQSMGLQSVRHNWETELDWTDHESCSNFFQYFISPYFLSNHLWAIQLSCLTLLESLGWCGEMRLDFKVKWPRTLFQLCRDSCDPQSWSTDLNKAFWTEWV